MLFLFAQCDPNDQISVDLKILLIFEWSKLV